jgi:ABC-type bacteriocin/lantibiotic exporter with double-glycine peptidase domain
MLPDGLTRISATVFQELRNAIFATVSQKAIRAVACSVYDHLLKLDLSFHLSRQTGGLTRAIDRGTKGISFLLTSMVFHIFPTALEISLVCGILVRLLYYIVSASTDTPRHTSTAGSSPPSRARPWPHTQHSLS